MSNAHQFNCDVQSAGMWPRRESVAKWFERQIMGLLQQSWCTVEPQPKLDTKTPDILLKCPGAPECVIECTVVFRQVDHEFDNSDFHMCGDDLQDAYRVIYSSLQKKIEKYRSKLNGRAFVVALRDESCDACLLTAMRVAFGGFTQYISLHKDTEDVVGRGWRDVWATNEADSEPTGLLTKYRDCSGLLYSPDGGTHYFLPNPLANVPIPQDIFGFASVPALELHPSLEIPIERGPTKRGLESLADMAQTHPYPQAMRH